jgi:hypothetical protein
VESNYLLAEDSRLPKWITLPDNCERKDVSVSLFLFTVGKASLIIRGPKPERKTIARYRIDADWHKSTTDKAKQLGTYAFSPQYYKASYKGVEDIIEFSCWGPVFKMTDDVQDETEIERRKCDEINTKDIGNPW